MHPTPHLASNIYEPSNANKVSMELDFFCACCLYLNLWLSLHWFLDFLILKSNIGPGGKMRLRQSQCRLSWASVAHGQVSAQAACELWTAECLIAYLTEVLQPKEEQNAKDCQGQACCYSLWAASKLLRHFHSICWKPSSVNDKGQVSCHGVDCSKGLHRSQKLSRVLVEIKTWLILNACLAVVFQTWLHGHVWPGLFLANRVFVKLFASDPT